MTSIVILLIDTGLIVLLYVFLACCLTIRPTTPRDLPANIITSQTGPLMICHVSMLPTIQEAELPSYDQVVNN